MTLPAPIVSDPAAQLNFESLNKKLTALQALAPTATVTSLPTSPTDGQEIEYLADATNGVVWRLKYRSASASAYKWEYVGGAELVAEVTTGESTSSTTYTALTTPGPSLTAPLAGDWDVEVMSREVCGGTSGPGYHGFDIGATAAIDANAALAQAGASLSNSPVAQRKKRVTVTAASSAIVSKYKSGGGVSIQFDNRRLSIRPVRVG